MACIITITANHIHLEDLACVNSVPMDATLEEPRTTVTAEIISCDTLSDLFILLYGCYKSNHDDFDYEKLRAK